MQIKFTRTSGVLAKTLYLSSLERIIFRKKTEIETPIFFDSALILAKWEKGMAIFIGREVLSITLFILLRINRLLQFFIFFVTLTESIKSSRK